MEVVYAYFPSELLKCTLEKEPQRVSFIERFSSLQRYKCASVIEKGPQRVSFIERFFFYCVCRFTVVAPVSTHQISCVLCPVDTDSAELALNKQTQPQVNQVIRLYIPLLTGLPVALFFVAV